MSEWIKSLLPWKKIANVARSIKPVYYPNEPSLDDKPGLSRQDVIGLFSYPSISGGRWIDNGGESYHALVIVGFGFQMVDGHHVNRLDRAQLNDMVIEALKEYAKNHPPGEGE
jgi:hypothetical protein